MRGLLIAGAGGHGKVVADIAWETGRWDKIAFLDDRFPELSDILSWPVLGKDEDAKLFLSEYTNIIVAIGDNLLRVELLRRFKEMGFNTPSLVHPSAVVSREAYIEEGVVVFAKAAVNAGAQLGFASIVNTGATVDHDCTIEEGAHVCPGVNLAGEVRIGKYSWIGIGSSVIQGVSIGANVMAGAGTVILKDVGDNVTVVGVPGRVVKKNDSN